MFVLSNYSTHKNQFVMQSPHSIFCFQRHLQKCFNISYLILPRGIKKNPTHTQQLYVCQYFNLCNLNFVNEPDCVPRFSFVKLRGMFQMLSSCVASLQSPVRSASTIDSDFFVKIAIFPLLQSLIQKKCC